MFPVRSTGWREGTSSRDSATHLDGVVLDAAMRQGLVAVRELGRRGQVVGAIELQTDGPVPAFSSTFCACHAFVATRTEAEQLAELVSLLEERRADVVIPSHDGTIELLRHHREEVERLTTVALAAEPALAAAVDKEVTLQVAGRLGIAVPRSVTVHADSELDAALDEIGVPVVLKPTRSWVEHDGTSTRLHVCVATDRTTAHAEAARMLEFGGSVLVQEYVTGGREAVSFVRADGRFVGEFAERTMRALPALGGSSVLRESIVLPADAIVDARRLVAEIDLDGYAEVEFRRDADGRAVLMEINPRLSASVEVAVRVGVDMPGLVLAWARAATRSTSRSRTRSACGCAGWVATSPGFGSRGAGPMRRRCPRAPPR